MTQHEIYELALEVVAKALKGEEVDVQSIQTALAVTQLSWQIEAAARQNGEQVWPQQFGEAD